MSEGLSLTESMDTRNTRPRKLAAGLPVAADSIAVAVWQPTLLAVARGLGVRLERRTETGTYFSAGATSVAAHKWVKPIDVLTDQMNLKSAHGAGERVRSRPRPNLSPV